MHSAGNKRCLRHVEMAPNAALPPWNIREGVTLVQSTRLCPLRQATSCRFAPPAPLKPKLAPQTRNCDAPKTSKLLCLMKRGCQEAASVRGQVSGGGCQSQVSDGGAHGTSCRLGRETHHLRVSQKAGDMLTTSGRLQVHSSGRRREGKGEKGASV